MHRSYQPITPANNKLLRKRWDSSSFNFHRKMVDTATPMIDNKPPKTYMHLHLKLKNLQIEEQRLAVIERDNRILLEKMSYIMRTRGSVDNRNDYEQKSLNKTKRQRELLRLTHENQAILKRINAKESHYKHCEWEADHVTQRRYLDNISKYPKYWHKRSKQKLKPLSAEASTNTMQSSAGSRKKADDTNDDPEQAISKYETEEAAVEAENKAENKEENETEADNESEKETKSEAESHHEAPEDSGRNDKEEPASENQETDKEQISEGE